MPENNVFPMVPVSHQATHATIPSCIMVCPEQLTSIFCSILLIIFLPYCLLGTLSQLRLWSLGSNLDGVSVVLRKH